VISSIPPPSTGPSPDARKISPPHLGGLPFSRRGVSPSPQRQYSSGSLGRSSARSFSSLLQAGEEILGLSGKIIGFGELLITEGYFFHSMYLKYLNFFIEIRTKRGYTNNLPCN